MCGIAGLINRRMVRENGARIRRGIVLQNDRGNGLGAGYAAYGIYPKFADCYALHVMSEDAAGMFEVEKSLKENFILHFAEDIPLWNKKITDYPLCRRFFVEPQGDKTKLLRPGMNEDDYTIEKVMEINSGNGKAFVFSSGKNMGVFKGVGTPADIYDFYRLDEYEGYLAGPQPLPHQYTGVVGRRSSL